ncbi:MAG: SDR family oxidoreductase [Puniceicoccaceae bacterium]
MSNLTSLYSLEGKTALVTGGYRGLGLSISRGLAGAGAKIILNGRSADGVEAAVEGLRKEGYDAHGAPFDITDEKAVGQSIENLTTNIGPIDILVNNAGIQKRHKLEEMPVEDFRTVLEVNLTAAFIVAKAVVPGMMEREGGKVINICSLMSDLARPTTGNYAAAKGGLRMLTRAMAGEWASSNIQVNGIGPGYFATEMTQKLKDDPDFNSWICGRTPAGRWGMPEELQGLAVFLASGASSFVNGQVIFVDGGLTAVI